MTRQQLQGIREAFLQCMDDVYNDSCVDGFDDGDYHSHRGWVADDDNLGDLCCSFIEWVNQVAANND